LIQVRAWFGGKLRTRDTRERMRLERAVKKRPHDGRSWLRLAELLARQSEPHAAIRAYARAADAFAAQAHERHAAAVLRQALLLSPGESKLRLRLAELYGRLGQSDRGCAELRLALEGAGSTEEREEAERVRKLLGEQDVLPEPAQESRAFELTAQGAGAAARSDVTQHVPELLHQQNAVPEPVEAPPQEAVPGEASCGAANDTSGSFGGPSVLEADPETLRDLAVGFLEMHAFARALESLAPLLVSSETRIATLPLAALGYVGLGQIGAAVAALEEAIERGVEADLEAAPLYYELGEVLLSANEPERALQAFLEVATLRPDFRDTQDRIRRIERIWTGGMQAC
jgi:tetratricopeptide (TPR) repeat protein